MLNLLLQQSYVLAQEVFEVHITKGPYLILEHVHLGAEKLEVHFQNLVFTQKFVFKKNSM
jgi:hypothetical protein